MSGDWGRQKEGERERERDTHKLRRNEGRSDKNQKEEARKVNI